MPALNTRGLGSTGMEEIAGLIDNHIRHLPEHP
jgi:hypothetical protein